MGIDFNTSGFSWRSAWVNPLESLWSVLRKFAFFNEANVKSLQDFFGAPPVCRLTWGSRKRLDLRRYGGFEPLLLQRAFGIDRDTLDDTTVIPFVAEDESLLLTSARLRFCPSCLGEGFHSSLHQILIIRECPLHGEPLTKRCLHCQTGVDYSLKSIPLGSSVGCPACVAMPATVREVRRKFISSSKERDEKFRLAAEFLRRRLKLETVAYSTSKWIIAKNSRQAQDRRIFQLSRYWMEVVNGEGSPLDLPKAGESYAHFDYRARTLPLKRSVSKTPKRIDLYHEFDCEQRLTMKSIRRRVEKLWLGPHRKCVTYLARRESICVRLQRGKPCPYANVLILWLLYWQEVDKLHHLLIPKRRWRGGGSLGLHSPHSFPRELLHRVFAIECLAILEECCLLVNSLRRHDQHTFNRAYLDDVAGRCMPYWIVEHRPDNMFRLHVWQRPNRRRSWSAICFPGVPKPSREGKCDHSPSRTYERQYGERRGFTNT